MFLIISLFILVNFFICLVAAHLADGILKHGVLTVQVVDSLFSNGVVVHWRLEEETEETLCAIATGTGSKVNEQTEIETYRSSKNAVAAEEVNLNLHGIAHPSEDVDIVPRLFVVVARRIVVDTHLVIIVRVEVWLVLRLEYRLKCREL